MLKLKDISDSAVEMLSSMPASGDTPQGWPLSLFLSSANTPALPSWEGMYSFMQAPCPLWASVSPSVTWGWGGWTTMVIQVPSSRLFFLSGSRAVCSAPCLRGTWGRTVERCQAFVSSGDMGLPVQNARWRKQLQVLRGKRAAMDWKGP